MGTIKWLHFSDLHLNKGGVETTRLREQLPEYLKKLDIHCDYVFCTGDVRYAPMGALADSTIDAIKSISNAVHVPLENFFITPGNHDIDRNVDGRDSTIRNVHFKHDIEHSGYYSSPNGEINKDDLSIILKGTQNYNRVFHELFTT